MRLTFLGAAREVTGSMLRVDAAGTSLLIDCGMYQGRRSESRRRNSRVPDLATSAEHALLTHAHVDHSGNLPVLVRGGFAGTVLTTAATRDLSAYMLRDAARIQAADADYLNRRHADDPHWQPIRPIYDEDDVAVALERMVCVPYRHPVTVAPGLTVTLLDAGHILGSAQVVIDVDDGSHRRLVVSGDLGRRGLPIIRDPEVPPGPIDVLVMESTYGDRRHGPLDQLDDQLAEVVGTTFARGGTVVVPAFALGRTQELLYAIHRLRDAGRLPPIPVYIDSPLAIDVTSVFRLHPECFDREARQELERHHQGFWMDGVHATRTREESMALNDLKGPALIIAASGMAEGGRILHHLRRLIGDPRNTVLVVGFMAQHTLGRRLVERRPKVRIWGVERELLAQVVALDGFSAHADACDLFDYAVAASAGRTYLVHGEPPAQEALIAALAARGRTATAPGPGEVVTVP